MIKKTVIVTAGVMLLLALMFGKKLVPYAQTAYERARNAVHENVPVEFQLDAARKQLTRIETEKKEMLYQIAKEQVAVENLENQLVAQQTNLDRQYANIMRLRDHLESGETHFVSHNRKFTSNSVKEDLANRFANFKVADETIKKTSQILDVRRQGLESAKTKLEQMIADQHTLALEIENLQARMHMLDVAKSANNISIDNSQLSRTRDMLNEIKARLDVEEEVLALTPRYVGSIPMEGETAPSSENILEDIDAYFADSPSDYVHR